MAPIRKTLTHCYNSRRVGTVALGLARVGGSVSGYSRGMDKWLVFVVAACAAATAVAQVEPLPAASDVEMQLSRQQKRLELRAAVSSANRRGEQTPPFPDTAPIAHQMTSQERAEMREQLRRYHPTPKTHP